MALGFGILRLSPAAFWAMTPRELSAAAARAAPEAIDPPDRATLDALAGRFPDRPHSPSPPRGARWIPTPKP